MTDELVLVVGAKFAERTAERYRIYCCQAGRQFRDVEWIAFYTNKRIRIYARILSIADNVVVSERTDLAAFQADRIAEGRDASRTNKLFTLGEMLSTGPIQNDLMDKNGEPTAWCQDKRYTTITNLRKAKLTSDL